MMMNLKDLLKKKDDPDHKPEKEPEPNFCG